MVLITETEHKLVSFDSLESLWAITLTRTEDNE